MIRLYDFETKGEGKSDFRDVRYLDVCMYIIIVNKI